MPRVRYAGGSTYTIRNGPTFEDEGDEADVDEETAERLTARPDFEVVDTDDDTVREEDGPPDETAGDSGTLPFNPADHTNDEIAEKVAEIDGEAALVALRNLEAEQKDRTGATDAIDDRLDELED